MLTVFTLAYNEALFIQFMIDHYRARFPDCHIVVYDNQSTDDTVKIAKSNGCDVVSLDTNNQIDDLLYLEIKNNVWKSAKTDWVLVCDMDELADINQEALLKEAKNDCTVIRFEAYDMINLQDDFNLPNIKYGVRNVLYDKHYLFNGKLIDSINYLPGCHHANPYAGPLGKLCLSSKVYPAYHYRYLNEDYLIARYNAFAARLSDSNKINGYGIHYLDSESQIRERFQQKRQVAQKVIP